MKKCDADFSSDDDDRIDQPYELKDADLSSSDGDDRILGISKAFWRVLSMIRLIWLLISNKMSYLSDCDPDYSLDPVPTRPANYNPCVRGNRAPFECPYKFGVCHPHVLFETFKLYINRLIWLLRLSMLHE